MQYNNAQQRAVAHDSGPMMVLAGPGSGKTAVITGRVVQLIKKGISPSSILVVTFTRAAAAEMKGRFLKMAGSGYAGVTFGTFHGIFYGILKHAYHINGGNILAEQERLQLIREILDHTYPNAEQEADLPSGVLREISQVKNSRLDLNHYYSGVLPQDVFHRVYDSYDKWKKENRRLDFDDITVECLRLFRNHPEILAGWQRRYRYILVDEFQDISPLQYEIIRMLAEPEQNLFIVGDDDQSIYRFRGASPEIMLHFPKDYPSTCTVTLEENYRSTPEILQAASGVIEKNQKRYRKSLRAASGHGKAVEVEEFANPREECRHIAETIRKEHAAGIEYKETAILFRTNTGCREAVEQLMAYQIPFRVGDMVPCIFDHWITGDILAYFRLAKDICTVRVGKRSDFLRIYNRPNRYISRDAFYDPQISFESLYCYYEDREWMVSRLEEWEANLKMIYRLSPYGAVNFIRREVRYEEYLREYAGGRNIPADELLQVLDELAESARNYRTAEEWIESMDLYREKLQEQQKKNADADGVMIATLHASKGMEYDAVYIPDVNEGIIPYHKAVLDADQEEERRMFYVGMTRARKILRISYVRERYEKKLDPSRFLKDLL
ncbi:MAG: ATP-dependent helicase [Eubacteriales bacterium]|nr:ATP-dependent helicase [Eubacteriales bacterium]